MWHLANCHGEWTIFLAALPSLMMALPAIIGHMRQGEASEKGGAHYGDRRQCDVCNRWYTVWKTPNSQPRLCGDRCFDRVLEVVGGGDGFDRWEAGEESADELADMRHGKWFAPRQEGNSIDDRDAGAVE